MIETYAATGHGGSRKHKKPNRFDLIPPRTIQLLAEHFYRGSLKYDERNWEHGQEFGVYWRSAMSHMLKFWDGKDFDDDPVWDEYSVPQPHEIVAALWQLVCLLETTLRVSDGTLDGLDDRPRSAAPPEISKFWIGDIPQ